MEQKTPIQKERSTGELLQQLAQLRDEADLLHLTLPSPAEGTDAWSGGSAHSAS